MRRRWIIPVFALVLIATACRKATRTDDSRNWTNPATISFSRDSLSSLFSVYEWNGTLLALNGDKGNLSVLLFDEQANKWMERVSPYPASWAMLNADRNTNRVVVCHASLLPDKMQVSFLNSEVRKDGRLSRTNEQSWHGQKTDLFGDVGPNVSIVDSPSQVCYRRGIVFGAEAYVPYDICGQARHGNTIVSGDSPYASGVFFSLDSGLTWKHRRLLNLPGWLSCVSKTDGNCYFFLMSEKRDALFYLRKPVAERSWGQVESISKLLTEYQAFGEEDTLHLCWLDRRHEKKRLNPVYPWRENYEVAYCHRKDSDTAWSKDVILSGGLRYAYAPTLSAEGHNVVVAWAGVRSDKDGRNEFDPSDIYYVISKDDGETWTKPMRVTDGFKAGITSARPQVVLRNGVIHLFYIQGKLHFQKTGGATRLNQPPWPILYRQRPFPK